MNRQGPEAGMQLEEDQPARNLWSGNRGIRAVTLGRKKRGEEEKAEAKMHKQETHYNDAATANFPTAARAVLGFKQEG